MDNILITTSTFGKNDPGVFAPLKEKGYQYFLNPYERKLTEQEVTELISTHHPDRHHRRRRAAKNRNVLVSAKGLRAIARIGIGMDNVDQVAAKELGISISNTPDGPTIPVAELTLGHDVGPAAQNPHLRFRHQARRMGAALWKSAVWKNRGHYRVRQNRFIPGEAAPIV